MTYDHNFSFPFSLYFPYVQPILHTIRNPPPKRVQENSSTRESDRRSKGTGCAEHGFWENWLTVRFSDSFQFILLFDSVGVRRSFRSIDQLISQTLSNGFDVAERSLTCTSTEEPNGLVDAAKWRHVHSLATDSSGATDASRVFPWTRIDDGVDQNLQWILSRQQVDDLKRMFDNFSGQQFLAVVSTMHHHRVRQSLHNRALSLSESPGSEPSG